MADIEIDGLTLKATPVSADEIEIQETGGGLSKKATLSSVVSNLEVSHSDVVQDGDFGSDGFLTRSGGAGSYSVDTNTYATLDYAVATALILG